MLRVRKEDLRLGMYVQGVEGSWFDHPFWRSKFLLTSADVIFPYFPIYNDETGQLDASVFYSLSPNLKIGVQAVNLTNEITTTLQQFTVGGLLGPRSYFMNDRRFSFIIRGNF